MLKRKDKRLRVYLGSVVGKLMADLDIDHYSRNVVFSRLKNEGPAFLTKTLPKFGKFLLLSLEAGSLLSISESDLTCFRWKGSSPLFLRGLLRDAVIGSADAVYRIRQLCEYFYKLSFSFSEKDLAKAEEKYVAIEKDLSETTISQSWKELLRKTFETLLPKCANSNVHDVFSSNRPRNGPGAFAGSAHIRKYIAPSYESYKRLSGRVTGTHPKHMAAFSGYFKPYPSAPTGVNAKGTLRSAEILFVPKDSRGPRVISKEPYLTLKAQMAYQDWFSVALERETDFRINFRSQSKNQDLCREGSLTGYWACGDLQDASDRVRDSLWLCITRNAPAHRWFRRHSRSGSAQLPSGSIIKLKKFANMGSGLCFPVLAVVVWLSATLAISIKHRVPLKLAGRCVYVYGDDLIVPSDYMDAAKWGLEQSGLVLNVNKSYSKGKFRESCGADYYDGIDVAPARLRLSGAKLGLISEYRDGIVPIESDNGILQLERHCRELIDKGLDSLADYYYNRLELVLGTLPKIARLSPVLGRYTPYEIISYSNPLYEPYTLTTPLKGYVSAVKHERFSSACPYKGMASFLKDGQGLGTPFDLVPLRRKVVLKYKVVSPSELLTYGTQNVPYGISG